MRDKLRIDLDGKEPGALTALIEDSLGKGARAGPDLGDGSGLVPIDSFEHLRGQES